MIPDFNRLRVFHLVMAQGGVSTAAKVLHVTQSAVSQHLLKLETELKTPLFIRLQNRLVPTQAAKRLFNVIDPFVASLDTEMQHLTRSRKEPFGLLRLGAPMEFGVHYLPKLIATFRAQHPLVSFDVTLGHPDVLLPRIEAGEVDVAFADLFNTNPEPHRAYALFKVDTVMDEALVLICSAKYNRTKLKGDHSFKSLGNADYIAYQEDGAALKSWFKYHFRKHPRPLRVVVTVESVQGVVACIKEDLGLGVVPSHIVDTEMSKGSIVNLRHRKNELKNRISLVQLLDKHPTLAERAFVKHVKQSI